jgi:hypothetical protein
MPLTTEQQQIVNANRAQAATRREATRQNALRQQQQPQPLQPQQVPPPPLLDQVVEVAPKTMPLTKAQLQRIEYNRAQAEIRREATRQNALRQQQQPQPPQPQQVPPATFAASGGHHI